VFRPVVLAQKVRKITCVLCQGERGHDRIRTSDLPGEMI
jgi:hypothetical protein